MMNALRKILAAMKPPVFFGAAGLCVAFVLFGTLASGLARRWFAAVQSGILSYFAWFYVFTTTALLMLVVYLLFSRHGHLRLGGPEAKPEFSYVAWLGMLFAAGMGIGLVFWGVAEPLTHYRDPPVADPETREAFTEAIRFTFFHWGLHPWAIYAFFGLALAYFHFRFGLPLAPRSLLYPLLGERIHGWVGHSVDVLATVGTLFGVATSLGFGAMQINAGLSELTPLPDRTSVQVGIIATITAVATVSVVTGLHQGIQRLSKANLALAGLLLLYVLLTGPTVQILETLVSGLGAYLQNLPRMSLWVDPTGETTWQGEWTFFYWSWWIAWSPFVGVFVARISRGRTVREFLLNVLLVPSCLTFVWLSVFGGSALSFHREGNPALAAAVDTNVALSLAALLEQLPFPLLTQIVALLLIIVFFITSSDSGSLVDDMVTSGGHPDPPAAQRVFWATSEGAVAATLLIAGGLQALRTASLVMGLPMGIILAFSGVALLRAFGRDRPGSPPDRHTLILGGWPALAPAADDDKSV